MARSTPDRVERYFDTITPEFVDQQRQYQEWLKQFGKRMSIKHNQAHVEVIIDSGGARYPGEVLVIARQVPRTEW